MPITKTGTPMSALAFTACIAPLASEAELSPPRQLGKPSVASKMNLGLRSVRRRRYALAPAIAAVVGVAPLAFLAAMPAANVATILPGIGVSVRPRSLHGP